MRKWFFIGGTVLAVALAFALVLWQQHDIRVSAGGEDLAADARPIKPATTQFGSIARTELAWVMVFDQRTALPKARFRGERFTPQAGDQLLVEKPEVEFFLGKNRDQVVRISGKTGLVTIPGEGPRIRSDLSSTPVHAPTRGEMRDVTVSYYPTQDAASARRAQVTMTLANAYFDSELYEIATETYTDADGKKIEGRQVPVIVRGESFEFDGKGLLIRWDESTERLKSLTVFHGDQLLIKQTPEGLGKLRARGRDEALGMMLASADNAQALAVLASAKRDADLEGHIYRATFHENVTVTQNQQTLAEARDMMVDFTDVDAASESAGRSNSPPPAAKPAAAASASTGARPTAENAQPASGNAPIVIRWNGPLTVVPAPQEEIKPQSGSDAIIRFVGSSERPITLQSGGGEIQATWAAYEVHTRDAWVEGSVGHPVVLTAKDGSVLRTPRLHYWQRQGKGAATLRGPSTAEIASRDAAPESKMSASWRDSADVQFAGDLNSQAIEQITLNGDVNVARDRIRRFDAGSLTLKFAPPTSENSTPQIQQIAAAKGVTCVLVDNKGQEQGIRAGNLRLMMNRDSGGQIYPAAIEASDDVVAENALERLAAQSIRAQLDPPDAAPSARGSSPELAGLRQLLAVGQVELNGPKGEVVKADRLQVRQSKERSTWVLLEGKPALVQQGQTSLAGPFIEVDTATEKALVTGGGKMTIADAKLPSAGSRTPGKAMPVEISWTGDGSLDGSANSAGVTGNVSVQYTAPDGMINQAWADKATMGLAKRPDAKPADNAQGFSFLADRYARQITLLPSAGKDVRLQQLLPGPDGTILRQLNLFAMRLDAFLTPAGVDRVEAPATAQQPGRFLYVALPTGTRRPIKAVDPMRNMDVAGSTAFAWHEGLVFDKATNQIDMRGDVMIRHEPREVGGKSFQADAASLLVDVADGKTKPAAAMEAMEIQRITLKGNPVRLLRDDIEIASPLIQIDPRASLVLARGTPNDQVRVDKGRMIGSFDSVEINTRTSEMSFKGARGLGRQ